MSPSEGTKSFTNGNGNNSAQFISHTVFVKRKEGGKDNNDAMSEKYSNKQMKQLFRIHEFVCENVVYLTGYGGPAGVPNGQSTKVANTGKHMCICMCQLCLFVICR